MEGVWMQKDFEFVKILNEEFFSKRNIQHALSVIKGCGISAWEPWWQVEFARYLSLHKGGHEWHREQQIEVDRRKDKEKCKLIADFIVRPKNHAKDRYILLELKQNQSVTTCVTNMAKDSIKIYKAKAASLDQRSFWSIGVHPKEDAFAKKNYAV
jgi:hypothetical protein